ncbi:MAG: hypothetical protein JWP12_3294 [Bacteroidetes bacterium]|nr:hypothetical protein [Bacteroidota bacterium]
MFFLLIKAKFPARFPAQKLAFFQPDFLVHLQCPEIGKAIFQKGIFTALPKERPRKNLTG